MTLTTRTVRTRDGVRLPYVEQGDPDGIPVLLLHGYSDSWRSWEPVLRHLPPTIRAVALTQRGHGDADRPPRGYGLGDLAADAADAIDALGLAPAIVAGHSMGSWVAQRLTIDHPGRVRAALLAACFGPVRDNEVLVEFGSEVAALRDPVDPEFVREFQLATIERRLPDRMIDDIVAESLKLPARLWRELYRGFLEADMSAELGSIEAPVLVISGERDAFSSRAEQDRVVDAIPGARREIYEGSGHAMHWEQPRRFAADLVAFAAAQRARRRTTSSSESSGRSKRALTA